MLDTQRIALEKRESFEKKSGWKGFLGWGLVLCYLIINTHWKRYGSKSGQDGLDLA